MSRVPGAATKGFANAYFSKQKVKVKRNQVKTPSFAENGTGKSHVCQEERIPMNEINRPLIYSFPIRLLPAPTGLKRFFPK